MHGSGNLVTIGCRGIDLLQNGMLGYCDYSGIPYLFFMEHWKNISNENIKEYVKEIGWVEEEWKAVKDFEGQYEVSSFGRVKSLNRIRESNNGRKSNIKGLFLKQHPHRQGYLKVVLCKEGITTTFMTHRLVANSFIQKIENKPFVNHKRGNKKDNRYHRLEWCTQSENVLHGFRVNNRTPAKGKKGKENPKSKAVLITNRFTGEKLTFESGMMATKALGLSSGSLSRVLNGKTKFTKSYYITFL